MVRTGFPGVVRTLAPRFRGAGGQCRLHALLSPCRFRLRAILRRGSGSGSPVVLVALGALLRGRVGSGQSRSRGALCCRGCCGRCAKRHRREALARGCAPYIGPVVGRRAWLLALDLFHGKSWCALAMRIAEHARWGRGLSTCDEFWVAVAAPVLVRQRRTLMLMVLVGGAGFVEPGHCAVAACPAGFGRK